MPSPYQFSIREALSDISGCKVLAPVASGQQVELDYALAASSGLSLVDAFITPAPLPNQVDWAKGEYIVQLTIVSDGPDISFGVELWRADLNGSPLEQIGATPSVQSAGGSSSPADPVVVTFQVSGQDIATDPTDRLLLQLYAENVSSSASETLGVLASASGIATPILMPSIATNRFNPFRRGKFLGFLWRRGDGARFFDKNGVNIDGGNNY